MKIRRFPAVVVATATIALVSFTTAVATQESSTPNTTSGAPATERVYLSSGAEDVLKLSRAKINDDITVAFIQNGNRDYNLTANDIVYLRKEGVSDRILTAMLNPQSQPAAAPPQSQPAATLQNPPPHAAPADAPLTGAPQYVTPPTSTTFVETAPASTVYLATTPTYYSFYDPWPYWSWWYPYPYFAFGFYWGNYHHHGYWYNGYCNNGHWNGHWNGYYHNGNSAPQGNSTAPNGNRPPPPNGNGNPRPPGGLSPSGQAGTLASGGRPSPGANQMASANLPNRSESRFTGTAPSGRPTSYWSNNGNQPATARNSTGQANAAVGRQAEPPNLRSRGVNPRSAVGGPNPSPANVSNGSARQPATVNQSAVGFARPGSVSARPSAVWSGSSQSVYRNAAGPSASYQRSSVSPAYRASGSAASISRPSMPTFSRPSMSASSPSIGHSGAFRGGGSFGGAGAPRMSSGGGFRGGGGGGRSR